MSSVYFIQCGEGGPIKIGMAVNVQRRLELLQTGCPHLLTVLAAVAGDRATERAFHERFVDLRMRGEWFWPARPLTNFINGVKAPAPLPPPQIASADEANPMRQIRLELGLTQKELGSHFGMRQAHICRMERADALHPRSKLALLALRDRLRADSKAAA